MQMTVGNKKREKVKLIYYQITAPNNNAGLSKDSLIWILDRKGSMVFKSE